MRAADEELPEAAASPEANESNSEEATPEPRLRLPQLLAGPFDIRSFALTGLFILAVFYTMYFMRSVLLPIVLAVLLSYLFRPLLRGLGKIGIRPAFAAGILLLGVIAALAYGVSFLTAPAAGWLEKAPYGLEQLQHKLMPLKRPIAKVAQASGEIEKLATPENPQTPTVVTVKPTPIAGSIFGRTPEFAVSVVLLLILLYFLLAYDEVFLTKLIKMLPRLRDKKRAVTIAHEIEAHISRYLLTVTLINTGLGIVVGTIVGLLGLSNALMWGVLVAVVNFVPYLGALTGIICMTVGAVLSFDSLGYAMLFPAVYLCVATIEGNLITPYVMGRSLTLNPVIILLSITFWGWLWGIAGVILAVPILAAFKILCTHLEPMEPVAEFLN